MNRWFRFYDQVLDDPKVQRLPPSLFKAWINLLCLASRHGGKLPDLPDVSFALRISEDDVNSTIDKLDNAGLMDATEDGWEPHNWQRRQFKSDNSTERVQKHRRNVSSEVSETESVTEILCSVSVSDNSKAQSRKVSATEEGALFERFVIACPKREGSNPHRKARERFSRAIRDGDDPEAIIAAAARWKASEIKLGNDGTRFVRRMDVWLNEAEWRDVMPVAPVQLRPPPEGEFIEHDSERWHEVAGILRQRSNTMLMPPAIHTLNGKRGAYVVSHLKGKADAA